jgi:hypothetical protein
MDKRSKHEGEEGKQKLKTEVLASAQNIHYAWRRVCD